MEGKTRFDLFTSGSAVRDLAIADLPPTAAAAPAAEAWQDVLRDPASLTFVGAAQRLPEGLLIQDGNRHGVATLAPGRGPTRDGAIRFRRTFMKSGRAPRIP